MTRPDMTRGITLTAIAADPTDAETLARLHSRLEAAAQSARLLDVAYRTVDSPVGRLLLVTTEEGLLRLAFEVQGHDAVLADLAAQVSGRVLRAPGRLDEPARQLDGYFAGSRRAFTLPLDLRLSRGFRREVLAALQTIGYGSTRSYQGVAAEAGSPGASRAVGTACALNPLPIVVPCHRVVRADGGLGGYAGGLDAKRALLDLEQAGSA